ncbi:hypothetical protein [Bdellovibrio sp. HCB337]|uniref:hypothetical protein n=1 Tax=Bdellovibrio sp. HCB337 TaxID=3394358 RepID=UPI0039A705A2
MMSQIDNLFKKIYFTIILMAGLVVTAGAGAQTTRVLTFDDVSAGSNLTTQYQGVGVTAAGATILEFAPWPSHSGANLAFAPEGLMEFAFNSTVTGNIRTVSAYVSGVQGTGIFAFDSAGNQVGQSVLGANAPNNTLLSVTSNTNPIVRVQIHDGGATFGVDDFTFVSEPTVPVCVGVAGDLYDAVSDLSYLAFKNVLRASSQKRELQKEVSYLEYLIKVNAGKKKILSQIKEIKDKAADWVRKGASQTELLNLLNQLSTLATSGKC